MRDTDDGTSEAGMRPARKPLSPEHQRVQHNLLRGWREKRDTLGLTQEKAAALLGFETQAGVSHYLRGYTPLNLEATLNFAQLLQMSPLAINPELDLSALYASDPDIEKAVAMLQRPTPAHKRQVLKIVGSSICPSRSFVELI
jgi:transcriptional regulator with XRE-family HTH domain